MEGLSLQNVIIHLWLDLDYIINARKSKIQYQKSLVTWKCVNILHQTMKNYFASIVISSKNLLKNSKTSFLLQHLL